MKEKKKNNIRILKILKVSCSLKKFNKTTHNHKLVQVIEKIQYNISKKNKRTAVCIIIPMIKIRVIYKV